MDIAKTIYRSCVEVAEMEYLRAKSRGIVSPVVELMALDLTVPVRVSVVVSERDELARILDDTCSGSAAVLRAAPPAGREMAIVVAIPEGMRVFHKEPPRS